VTIHFGLIDMLRGSIALGRVAGIDIRAHFTWVLAFVFVALSTARGWFPTSAPGFDSTTYALMGASAALCLFDGFSNIDEPQEPSDELLISIVGPLASFALAGVFWVIGQTLVTAKTPTGEVVTYLVVINLLIGGFNLLPCYPLDGGRVVHSVIWRATGNPVRATWMTAKIGQVLAAVLIGLGVSQLFAGQTSNGLWIGVTGWFLGTLSVRTLRQQNVVSDGLRGMRVADLMDTRPAYAGPDMTVEEFVVEHALRGGRLELVVLAAGRLAGIVTVAAARTLPQERWSTTPVARMMSTAPLPVLAPESKVNDVLAVLAASPFAQVPVVRDDLVVGMFGRADVTRFRWLRTNLNLQAPHVQNRFSRS
jgi:CBS domain-containing protein